MNYDNIIKGLQKQIDNLKRNKEDKKPDAKSFMKKGKHYGDVESNILKTEMRDKWNDVFVPYASPWEWDGYQIQTINNIDISSGWIYDGYAYVFTPTDMYLESYRLAKIDINKVKTVSFITLPSAIAINLNVLEKLSIVDTNTKEVYLHDKVNNKIFQYDFINNSLKATITPPTNCIQVTYHNGLIAVLNSGVIKKYSNGWVDYGFNINDYINKTYTFDGLDTTLSNNEFFIMFGNNDDIYLYTMCTDYCYKYRLCGNSLKRAELQCKFPASTVYKLSTNGYMIGGYISDNDNIVFSDLLNDSYIVTNIYNGGHTMFLTNGCSIFHFLGCDLNYNDDYNVISTVNTNLELWKAKFDIDADTVDNLHFWTGTQAEYDAITTKSDTTIYIIKG